MTRDEIKTKVLEQLSKIDSGKFNGVEVKEEDLLRDDLGLDSLDAVEFVMNLEKEFNIGIPDDEADEKDNCSVSEMIDYIKERIK